MSVARSTRSLMDHIRFELGKYAREVNPERAELLADKDYGTPYGKGLVAFLRDLHAPTYTETFVENGHTYYLAAPEVAARYRRGGDLFDPADLEKP